MKHLSNLKLDQEFAVVVKTERKITHEVLLFIQEINKRSLHLSFGFDSLRDYLIKRHHYSEGAANRRIGAMRMLTEVPEVSEKIIEGSLNLTQLAVAQSAIYQKQKKENIKMSKEEKAELLLELENKSLEETKSEIANTLDIDIKEKKAITYGKDDTAYLNLKLTKEELEIVKETLSLMSHQVKDPKELLINFCKKALKTKKEFKEKKVAELNKTANIAEPAKNSSAKEPTYSLANLTPPATRGAFATKSECNKNLHRSRYITANVRRQVFIRDKFMCQFKGENGHLCESKMFLQPHHIIAFAKGGENTLDNLSLRCRAHNLFEAEKDGFERFRAL